MRFEFPVHEFPEAIFDPNADAKTVEMDHRSLPSCQPLHQNHKLRFSQGSNSACTVTTHIHLVFVTERTNQLNKLCFVGSMEKAAVHDELVNGSNLEVDSKERHRLARSF